MKNILLIFLLIRVVNGFAQGFRLENGDLIFQESCPKDKDNPIKQVTNSIDSYQFTHVGMVYINSTGKVYVLEATIPEVKLTPIHEYLYPSESKECYPVSVVGRLKKEYRHLIPDALNIGLTLTGKAYDHGFIPDNDKYYCSELIYCILKEANGGNDVFPLNVMTFKSKDTGQTAKGWIEHFNTHNLEIPEGKPGINPGAMSKSGRIDIIHYY